MFLWFLQVEGAFVPAPLRHTSRYRAFAVSAATANPSVRLQLGAAGTRAANPRQITTVSS